MTPLKKLLCIVLSVVTITASAPFASIFTILKSEPISAKASTIANDDFSYKQVSTTQNETYIEITNYLGNDTDLVIPSEVDGCKVVGISAKFYKSGINFQKIVISEGIKYIGNESFSCLESLIIELPSTLEYIGELAFQDTEIESINFPEGLIGISSTAFEGAEFKNTEIILPSSLLYIDCVMEKEPDNGFYDTFSSFYGSNITSIYYSDNVRFVSNLEYSYFSKFTFDDIDNDDIFSPLYECNYIEKIQVSKENPYLESLNNVLYTEGFECLLSCSKGYYPTLSIHNNTKVIAPFAFSYCLIDTLNIGKSVEGLPIKMAPFAEIGEITFINSSNLTVISDYTFEDAALSGDLVLPKSLKYIGESAFAETDITSLSFETPSNCKTICLKAFYNCNELESVFIPNSVTKIGAVMGDDSTNSFPVFKCTNLKDIVFENNSKLRFIPEDAFSCYNAETLDFGQNSSIEIIYCRFEGLKSLNLTGCSNLYNIKDFAYGEFDSVDLSNTKIRFIPNYCFRGCKNLTDVKLSDETHYILNGAFENCILLSNCDLTNVGYFDSTAFSSTKIPVLNYNKKLMTYDNYKYYEYNENIVIWSTITNPAEKSELIIPDTIDGKPVTGIENGAFSNYQMKSVTIPDTVTYIGSGAFKNCNLENAPKIPNNVTYIGDNAFEGNFQNSVDIVIPDKVTYIGKNCFKGCNISSLAIGKKVESIGSSAFSNCKNISEITIPDCVKDIERNAFYNCGVKEINFEGNSPLVIEAITYYTNTYTISGDEAEEAIDTLECINVSEDNTAFTTENGVLYNKDKTKIICYPFSKSDENYVMPDSVVEIPENCFAGNKFLKSIDLSDNLNKIGNNAFNSSSLTQITIPSSVSDIGISAFENCSKLENVKFDDNVSLPSLNKTFYNCEKLKTVEFGENVSISKISNYAFSFTAITSIKLPDDVNIITDYAFSNKSSISVLTEVTLPNNLTTLNKGAFCRTSIEKIEMPDSLKYIGKDVFSNCKSLNIVLLNKIEGIDNYAFRNCDSLESIDLTGITALSKTAFSGCDNLKKFCFTVEEKEAYITENQFEGNETIETVVIGNSVNEIQDRAFADCTNLQTALIADEVENISDTAFENCDNLTIVCLYASPAMYYAQKNNIRYETFVISPIPDQEYTGKSITPALDVKQAGKALKVDKDYSATYKNNINVGTASVTVVGLGDYRIFATTSNFKIVKTKADETTTKPTTTKPTTTTKPATAPSIPATTKPTTTSPTTTAVKTTVAKAPSGAKKVNGEWVNTKQKKTSVKSIKKGKKSFKATWKKVTGVTGYQIQYSTSPKFYKSKTKSITVKGSKNTSKTIKKLKSKKKYYVRIRTYKNVKFNGKTVKVYSSWSKVKSVKTK
ncbi:MAG: leucine-rich repeat domain-containing protein [Eubacterium sp.]